MFRLPTSSNRTHRWLLCALLLLTLSASAQKPADAPDSLVIWIIAPGASPRQRSINPASVPGYQEQTAGTFGHTAGSVGQTAGSTGQTAGSFGRTAGSTGQTAGSTGQTAGSFGSLASANARNAGDAGTTMGNFGTSTSNLAATAAAANRIPPPRGVPRRAAFWTTYASRVLTNFLDFRPIFVDIYAGDLTARLAATAGTPDFPDILLGYQPSTLDPALSRYTIQTIWSPLRTAQTEDAASVQAVPQSSQAAMLLAARHPDEARALLLWMADGGSFVRRIAATADFGNPELVAERAFRDAIAGSRSNAEMDPDSAGYTSPLAAETLPSLAPDAKIDLRVEATRSHITGVSAVVALRAIESTGSRFDVAHALAVLRKDASGTWRVLHLSGHLSLQMQQIGFNQLVRATTLSRHSEDGKPLGISQAAPADHDHRPAQPELWWDNLGGATLQVVEWTGQPTGINLFFVPDDGSRLRTRVIARFADTPGNYRWRVWSIGGDGTVVLSPWRNLDIVSR